MEVEVEVGILPHAKSSVSNCLTLSLGISSMVPQPELSLETLVAPADRALYQAKEEGRDCICIDEQATFPIDP
ncbi:diguanylate cyclase domain-containing protein [Altericista sp. CCNU0014]|uniref:diguanylate cyclase domain-containing protein n=1 Tax=Altericista sp. CCNU0014 TaxID=3082949 RepID=UPI00385126A8